MTVDWRMPGEWERHERTYLGWPQWLEDPKKGQKDPAQVAFAAVAKAIAEFEPVTVAANPDQVTHFQDNKVVKTMRCKLLRN